MAVRAEFDRRISLVDRIELCRSHDVQPLKDQGLTDAEILKEFGLPEFTEEVVMAGRAAVVGALDLPDSMIPSSMVNEALDQWPEDWDEAEALPVEAKSVLLGFLFSIGAVAISELFGSLPESMVKSMTKRGMPVNPEPQEKKETGFNIPQAVLDRMGR
jgi:hypothetical protein